MQCGRDLCDGRQEKRGEEVMEEARRGGGDGGGALAGDRGARVSAADTGVSSDTDNVSEALQTKNAEGATRGGGRGMHQIELYGGEWDSKSGGEWD